MKPYYQDKRVTIYHGNCLEMSLEGISAVVTDPPYELGFMGKSWDSRGVSYREQTWRTLRAMCLPGAPLLSFGGTRTFHRIACAIEDAGWEIRDTLMWVYGSGFPKSLDISKAIDKQAGAEREVTRAGFTSSDEQGRTYAKGLNANFQERQLTAPATPEAQLWNGYGTALKPAYEPIILAMNPLDGTFANNALKHGVAGLNVDGCRVEAIDKSYQDNSNRDNVKSHWGNSEGGASVRANEQGRFPANFIHDGSQMVLELFPNSDGCQPHRVTSSIDKYEGWGTITQKHGETIGYDGKGSAARFFYCAKASKSERNRGCEGLELKQTDPSRKEGNPGGDNPRNRGVHKVANNHPCVKPLALMEYLCKLVKYPQYNLVLDPFCGSGTTLLACIRLGIPCIGIDNDESSCEIAARRCSQEVMELAPDKEGE